MGKMVRQREIAEKMRENARPSTAQKRYLKLGLDQPGGKLPLFDNNGQKIAARTIRSCVENGWCEPWYLNPIEPRWLVCKLTPDGQSIAKK